MISLRLSETEYQSLKKHYRNYGARNVSDLARLALRRILDESLAYESDILARIDLLDERVALLESRLPQPLEGRFEGKKASA